MTRETIRIPADVTFNTKYVNEDNFIPSDKPVRVTLDVKDNGKFKKVVKITVDVPDVGLLFEVVPKERVK